MNGSEKNSSIFSPVTDWQTEFLLDKETEDMCLKHDLIPYIGKIRSGIYLTCGWIMVVTMVGFGIAKVSLACEVMSSLCITFWVETILLITFGVAWMVAGKFLKFLVDDDEIFRIFPKRNKKAV